MGAGHDALVAAAYLLDARRSVCLIEQMARPGGWVQTAELGAPGFHYEGWSALHPFFVGGPAWTELGPDLSRHGLEYVTAPLAMASSLPDGRAAVAPVDPEAFAEELERLGETAGRNARACRCSTFHTHRGVTLPGHVRHGGVGSRNR